MLFKNENIVLRTVHGSFFLIDISDNYSGDKCSLFEINETGMFLWNKLDEDKFVDSLTLSLQRAIIDEVSYDVLFNDVADYIEELKSKNFIMEVAENG